MTVIDQCLQGLKPGQNNKRKLTTHQTQFMVATVTRHAVEHGESRQRPKIKIANGNHHRQYRHSNQHRPINLQRSEKEGGEVLAVARQP